MEGYKHYATHAYSKKVCEEYRKEVFPDIEICVILCDNKVKDYEVLINKPIKSIRDATRIKTATQIMLEDIEKCF